MKIGDNVMIVCSYDGMAETFRKILKEYKLDVDILVLDNRFGLDMPKVLEYINQAAGAEKEIIISRGFLARQISENLDFKVIEINISGADVLRVLKKYAGQDIRIGVVEVRAYIEVVVEIAEILGLSVKIYEVAKLTDFDLEIRRAAADGADVIVGGAWQNYDPTLTEHYPVVYERIESGESSIRRSLESYLKLCELSYQDRRQKELFQTVMDFSRDGLLAVNEEGQLQTINAYAAEFLEAEAEELRGRTLRELDFPLDFAEILSERRTSTASVCVWKGKNALINLIPAVVNEAAAGAVITVKRAEDVEADEARVRTGLSRKGLRAKYTFDSIQGTSSAICELKRRAAVYAATDATVLIMGESGTGKEVFAQAIHNGSGRRANPFVAINCSSLPRNLLESELFGYAEGAFTGARKGGKPGVFELAHRGTLFLDEIGEIDAGVQALLLRAIQEKEIMRIGDEKVISIDVRIIAATNKDLYAEVFRGNFREDLYFRLSILDLRIPPLRERREDIRLIAEQTLKVLNRRYDYRITGMEEAVLRKLREYDWPGNVRELNNAMEKMAIVVRYGTIHLDQVISLFTETEQRQRLEEERGGGLTGDAPFLGTLEELEKKIILQALKRAGGNKTKAAQALGIDRKTLLRRLSAYDEENE